MALEKETGIIILAAGASTRLGQPKQLLPYKGTTLLQHSIQAAINSIASHIIVVLGACEQQIRIETEWHTAQVISNNEWHEGMASSIRCGINELTRTNPSTNGVIIMLCDQPFVTTDLLNELMTTHKATGKAIIGSQYNHIVGVPAFFQKNIFPELLQLTGDTGAHSIIQSHPENIAVIPFSKGSIDIDTPADYPIES